MVRGVQRNVDLDRIKWIEGFVKSGVEINLQDVHKERYDIPVVNEENAQIFIDGLIKDGYSFDKDDIADEFLVGFRKKQLGGIYMILCRICL